MINAHCCSLCLSADLELMKPALRDGSSEFKVCSCQNCGHVQLSPKPTGEDDRKFYDQNLQDRTRGKEISYQTLLANNKFDTDRHVEQIKQITEDKNCRILDVGSGYGFFINALHNAGYENVSGLEISEERRSLGLKNGKAESFDYDLFKEVNEVGQFDIITLFHVLEHLADPITFLKTLRRYLKPEAHLIIEVPNVDELLISECPAYNDFYWIRAHVSYFSKKSLAFCLGQSGYGDYTVSFVQRYGIQNLCNWLSTGEPQIDRPVFQVPSAYKWLEDHYRERLEISGKTDAMVAICRDLPNAMED